MGGALYTLYILKDPFERMVPSLIFGLLLICRLVILYQVNKREEKLIKKEIERQMAKDKDESVSGNEIEAEETKKVN